MDKLAGILLIALLVIVFAVSLSYYVLNQTNQTSNNPSPTPTSTEPASIPKPSVPEFTLQFVGSPYNALIVTVKNQPYDSAYGSMYYNIRLKDHNAGNDSWTYPLDQLFYAFNTYPTQSSDSDYTNISLTIQSNFLIQGTENDIQVRAMLGSITRDPQYVPAPYIFNGTTSDWSNTQTIRIP